jgi:hypothetical protein
MTDTKWFSLRGEQYQYDGGWWRKLKVGDRVADNSQCRSIRDNPAWIDTVVTGSNVPSRPRCEYRVPCSQPFQVGDKVRVVSADTESGLWVRNMTKHVGNTLAVEGVSLESNVKVGGYYFPPHCLEPAPPSTPDYTPPDGWRVKGDDELVERGDAFSHSTRGNEWGDPNPISQPLTNSVRNVRDDCMPNGGYILAPIVSQEPQTDDMDGWEIYEPVEGGDPNDGVQYSEGTEWAHRHRPSLWHQDGLCSERAYNNAYLYRRPIQKPIEPAPLMINPVCPICGIEGSDHSCNCHERVSDVVCRNCRGTLSPPAHKPLDVHLPEIERKINPAAVKKPEILDWWRAEKEKLAIDAGKRIGGGM